MGTEADNFTVDKENMASCAGSNDASREEKEAAKGETARSAKQSAKEKLEMERKDAKDKTFAEPVIGYLLKRCEEDEGLSQDVVQKHKTWNKCFDYIYEQARKQAKGNRCAVRDDVVYEWAEDYYHRDDKAEEEKKAKEAEERKKKEAAKKKEKDKKVKKESTSKGNNAKATTLKNGMDNHKNSKEEIATRAEKEAQKPQSKKNNKDIDGQMDLFSFISM